MESCNSISRALFLGVLWCAALVSAGVQASKIPPPPPVAPRPGDHPLVWDSMVKEYKAKAGETTNMFVFSVTNCGTAEVLVTALRPSCGCTVAQLPAQPWRLAAGSNGQITATINFAGKSGLLEKTIYVETSRGPQLLMIKVDAPAPANAMEGRQKNMQLALADRQAVFKGDCASCHAAPAHEKTGQALFAAVCAICHETEHRAAFVPDLAQPRGPRDAAFWKEWISKGRDGTLMPGFSEAKGGPLTDEQVASLVKYGMSHFPLFPLPPEATAVGRPPLSREK
jgi:mono/diheme cytochrome c family protein